MRCFHPLRGYRKVSGGLSFTPSNSYVDTVLTVRCGQCIGCRLERSRQWAVRMMHEAKTHSANCFLTLTYNDDHAPRDGSLRKGDFQKFIKRLRKRIPERVRYFHCGEYGSESGRPHYHACLFGYDFPDRRHHRIRDGNRVWRSELLEELWSYGFSEIGDLTFESAAYVARYVVKKVTGSRAQEYYGDKEPEYATMSLKPAIGREWLEKFHGDVYPSDEVISRGVGRKPPRYYDLWYQEQNPEGFEAVQKKRRLEADRKNATAERLQVQEVCAKARLDLYSPRTGVE